MINYLINKYTPMDNIKMVAPPTAVETFADTNAADLEMLLQTGIISDVDYNDIMMSRDLNSGDDSVPEEEFHYSPILLNRMKLFHKMLERNHFEKVENFIHTEVVSVRKQILNSLAVPSSFDQGFNIFDICSNGYI